MMFLEGAEEKHDKSYLNSRPNFDCESLYCNFLSIDCVTDRTETTLTRHCLFELELLQMAAHGGIL
jgi:hypothetical protein